MKLVEIKPACLAHASFVTANLRQADKDEIFCQMPDGFKTYEIAGALIKADCYVAYYRGRPTCFFGNHPINVCTLDLWAMGTKDMWKVTPEVTRFAFRNFVTQAIKQGFIGAECRSLVGHTEAHAWLLATGAKKFGEPFAYGKNGELFQMFRWDASSIKGAAERYGVRINV